MTQDRETMFLRSTPERAVARELDESELLFYRGVSHAVEGGRITILAFTSLLVDAIRAGADRERARRALRSLGQIGAALVVFLGAQRGADSSVRIHDAIRK